MRYEFHWAVLWSGQSGRWLLQGLATTVELSALGWVLAAAVGRDAHGPVAAAQGVRDGLR